MQCVATTAAKKKSEMTDKRETVYSQLKMFARQCESFFGFYNKKKRWGVRHPSLQEAATEKAQSPFVFNCNFGTFKKQLETILKV